MNWSASSGEAHHITKLEKNIIQFTWPSLSQTWGLIWLPSPALPFLQFLSLFCTDPQNLSLTEARQRKREPYDIFSITTDSLPRALTSFQK